MGQHTVEYNEVGSQPFCQVQTAQTVTSFIDGESSRNQIPADDLRDRRIIVDDENPPVGQRIGTHAGEKL